MVVIIMEIEKLLKVLILSHNVERRTSLIFIGKSFGEKERSKDILERSFQRFVEKTAR